MGGSLHGAVCGIPAAGVLWVSWERAPRRCSACVRGQHVWVPVAPYSGLLSREIEGMVFSARLFRGAPQRTLLAGGWLCMAVCGADWFATSWEKKEMKGCVPIPRLASPLQATSWTH